MAREWWWLVRPTPLRNDGVSESQLGWWRSPRCEWKHHPVMFQTTKQYIYINVICIILTIYHHDFTKPPTNHSWTSHPPPAPVSFGPHTISPSKIWPQLDPQNHSFQYLSGWWLSPTSLKKMFSLVGMIIPNIWKKCSKPPTSITCFKDDRSWRLDDLGVAPRLRKPPYPSISSWWFIIEWWWMTM